MLPQPDILYWRACTTPGCSRVIASFCYDSVELESYLEARGKREQLAEIRKISNMINFAYVRQGEPLGLGHAVLVARELIGDEPFAVILGDDVIDAEPPAIKQLIDVFERVDGPVLAVERVPRQQISNYGVIAPEPS